jgi:hypothetical protein
MRTNFGLLILCIIGATFLLVYSGFFFTKNVKYTSHFLKEGQQSSPTMETTSLILEVTLRWGGLLFCFVFNAKGFALFVSKNKIKHWKKLFILFETSIVY